MTQAPCVVTVCADVHRFSMWCRQRDADPAYDKATGQKLADMGSFVGGLTPDKLGDYIGKIFA